MDKTYISLKELLNETEKWNQRKFHRHRKDINTRYKLDLDSFKKSSSSNNAEDEYAFPTESKDLFKILLNLYEKSPFKGKGKDPFKLKLEDLYIFQKKALTEIETLFNTEHQELLAHPAVWAAEIEMNALEDIISKQAILMKIITTKPLETRASFWTIYSQYLNQSIINIYEMEKCINELNKENMQGFEPFFFADNGHTSLDFLIAHYINHSNTEHFKEETAQFYKNTSKTIQEFESQFFSDEDKAQIDFMWENNKEYLEKIKLDTLRQYILKQKQSEIARFKNFLIPPSEFLNHYKNNFESESLLNEDDFEAINEELKKSEKNIPEEFKKIVEQLYASAILKSIDQ